MDFSTEISKPQSQKITLVEIDAPVVVSTWISYEAGIWFINLTPGTTTVTGSDGLVGYYAGQNEIVYNIQSLRVEAELYTKVTSLASLRTQNKSFYYDLENRTLYVHFDEWGYPLDRLIRAGAVWGFCDITGEINKGYYEDVYYEPRVVGTPKINKNKDPLFFGLIEFQGGSVSFINNDGFFDDFGDLDIFGQPVRVLLGVDGMTYDEFRAIYTGYVEDFDFNWQTFQLNIQDPRKKLSREIPIRVFDDTTYPDINENNINKPMPFAYGDIYDAPTVCLNEEDGTGPYVFMFCDPTDHEPQALTEVRVDGVAVTPSATDVPNGLFYLTSAQCMDGGSLKTVTCDFTGASIENGLDVIVDLLDIYIDLEYIAENYEIAWWNYEQSLAADVGLYIGDKSPLREYLEKICVALNGLLDVTPEGKFIFRTYDPTRDIAKVIQDDEWFDDPSIEYNSDEFLSSVVVAYQQSMNDTDVKKRVINSDYEDEVYRRFKVYREKTIDTVLVDESAASALAEDIMDRSQDIYPIVKRKTGPQNIDLALMDFVACNHRRESEEPQWKKYEVIGIISDDDYHVELTLKYVADYDLVEYEVNQGYIYFNRIYGHVMYGPTKFLEVA